MKQGRKLFGILFKCQIAGALFACLVTAAVCGFCWWYPPRGQEGFPDFRGMLLILSQLPTWIIVNLCGAKFGWNETPQGNLTLASQLISLGVNAVLGFIGGTVIGLPFKLGGGKILNQMGCAGSPEIGFSPH